VLASLPAADPWEGALQAKAWFRIDVVPVAGKVVLKAQRHSCRLKKGRLKTGQRPKNDVEMRLPAAVELAGVSGLRTWAPNLVRARARLPLQLLVIREVQRAPPVRQVSWSELRALQQVRPASTLRPRLVRRLRLVRLVRLVRLGARRSKR
jgi:hypothetical protein